MKVSTLLLFFFFLINVSTMGLPHCANSVLERENCNKSWTVLIFMEADNDLSPYALWDLYEMERNLEGALNLGATTSQIDVVVELDTFGKKGIKRLLVEQSDKKYEVQNLDYFKNEGHVFDSQIVGSFSEENEPSVAKKFENFLDWAMLKYPSENYMVVVWGHGEGFVKRINSEKKNLLKLEEEKEFSSPFLTLSEVKPFELTEPVKKDWKKNFGGVAFDDSSQTFLDADDLKRILDKTVEKVDVLAFDACLMQNFELLFELSDSVDYIVGSTQVQNYLGLPYRFIFDFLNSKDASPYQLAKEIPSLGKLSFSNEQYQGKLDSKGFESLTLSSINTWQLRENFTFHLKGFSEALVNFLNEDEKRVLDMRFLLENSPNFLGETRDIGMFIGLVDRLIYNEKELIGYTEASLKLKKSLNMLLSSFSETMMNYQYGPLYYERQNGKNAHYLLGFFRGLSIWLPSSSNLYQNRLAEYSNSLFFKSDTSLMWKNFIKKVWKSSPSPFAF